MAQTIRLTSLPSISSPTLFLWTLAGSSAGDVAGYTLTENSSGAYSTSVADTVSGELIAEVQDGSGDIIGTDRVTLSGTSGSEAWVGTETKSDIATEILSSGDVDGFNLEETLKLCLAALAGKLDAGTTSVVIRAADDSKDRITATVTSDGDRTSITLDAT